MQVKHVADQCVLVFEDNNDIVGQSNGALVDLVRKKRAVAMDGNGKPTLLAVQMPGADHHELMTEKHFHDQLDRIRTAAKPVLAK